MANKPGWLPVATGVVTTGLAVWVALSVSQPAEPSDGTATNTEVVTTVLTSVATAPSSTVTLPPVVITTPPPEMEGLSEAVARVLSSNGFASELSEQDIANQLPPSVYRTLVDQGAVLTIATEGDGQ